MQTVENSNEKFAKPPNGADFATIARNFAPKKFRHFCPNFDRSYLVGQLSFGMRLRQLQRGGTKKVPSAAISGARAFGRSFRGDLSGARNRQERVLFNQFICMRYTWDEMLLRFRKLPPIYPHNSRGRSRVHNDAAGTALDGRKRL